MPPTTTRADELLAEQILLIREARRVQRALGKKVLAGPSGPGVKTQRRGLRKSVTQTRGFNFEKNERRALVAFLRTLTDTGFTKAERFSDPFR